MLPVLHGDPSARSGLNGGGDRDSNVVPVDSAPPYLSVQVAICVHVECGSTLLSVDENPVASPRSVCLTMVMHNGNCEVAAMMTVASFPSDLWRRSQSSKSNQREQK